MVLFRRDVHNKTPRLVGGEVHFLGASCQTGDVMREDPRMSRPSQGPMQASSHNSTVGAQDTFRKEQGVKTVAKVNGFVGS